MIAQLNRSPHKEGFCHWLFWRRGLTLKADASL